MKADKSVAQRGKFTIVKTQDDDIAVIKNPESKITHTVQKSRVCPRCGSFDYTTDPEGIHICLECGQEY